MVKNTAFSLLATLFVSAAIIQMAGCSVGIGDEDTMVFDSPSENDNESGDSNDDTVDNADDSSGGDNSNDNTTGGLLDAAGDYSGSLTCGDSDNLVQLSSGLGFNSGAFVEALILDGFNEGSITLFRVDDETYTTDGVTAFGTGGHTLTLTLDPSDGTIAMVLSVAGNCSATLRLADNNDNTTGGLLDAAGDYSGSIVCGDSDNLVQLSSGLGVSSGVFVVALILDGFNEGSISLFRVDDETYTADGVTAFGTGGHTLTLTLDPSDGTITMVLSVAGNCGATLRLIEP